LPEMLTVRAGLNFQCAQSATCATRGNQKNNLLPQAPEVLSRTFKDDCCAELFGEQQTELCGGRFADWLERPRIGFREKSRCVTQGDSEYVGQLAGRLSLFLGFIFGHCKRDGADSARRVNAKRRAAAFREFLNWSPGRGSRHRVGAARVFLTLDLRSS